MNEMIAKLKEWLESDEGKEDIKRFAEKIKREEMHRDRWVEKFKSKYENNLDYAIEKLMDKYYSDKYVNREYKIGVQPRDPLLWLVFEYASKYCKPCKNKKYLNMFTGEAYYIGSYVIQVMHGQGSVLRIDKK